MHHAAATVRTRNAPGVAGLVGRADVRAGLLGAAPSWRIGVAALART